MGNYTYLVGLAIWGSILFIAGLIAAKHERAEAPRHVIGKAVRTANAPRRSRRSQLPGSTFTPYGACGVASAVA